MLRLTWSQGVGTRPALACSSFFCFEVFLVKIKVPVPALQILNLIPSTTVNFLEAMCRALLTLLLSANSTNPNRFSPDLLGYFLALLILASSTIPHLWVISKNCFRFLRLIFWIGWIQIVLSNLPGSRYFSFSNKSTEIPDFSCSLMTSRLLMATSSIKLFLRNTYSTLVLELVNLLYRQVAPTLVMQLKRRPSIFRALFLLATNASIISLSPLSLILLWPISMHSRVGLFKMMFWATDLAPSQPILLLNKFRKRRDLLSFKATASSVAPGTPSWFLLKSRTQMILLQGRTEANALMPSLPSKFLERSRTLI